MEWIEWGRCRWPVATVDLNGIPALDDSTYGWVPLWLFVGWTEELMHM